MELPQKILGEKIAFGAQQLYCTQKLDVDVLWYRRRVYKIRKKKRKKKRNKPHRDHKWVGWDKRVS